MPHPDFWEWFTTLGFDHVQLEKLDSMKQDSLVPRSHPLTRRNSQCTKSRESTLLWQCNLATFKTFRAWTTCTLKKSTDTQMEMNCCKGSVHNNSWSHNLIGPYQFWVIRQCTQAGHQTGHKATLLWQFKRWIILHVQLKTKVVLKMCDALGHT